MIYDRDLPAAPFCRRPARRAGCTRQYSRENSISQRIVLLILGADDDARGRRA